MVEKRKAKRKNSFRLFSKGKSLPLLRKQLKASRRKQLRSQFLPFVRATLLLRLCSSLIVIRTPLFSQSDKSL